jgi:hypothetical protein
MLICPLLTARFTYLRPCASYAHLDTPGHFSDGHGFICILTHLTILSEHFSVLFKLTAIKC